jgi:mannose-6-phosphate isomerase-like protein (cupin superfamily)
VGYGAGQIGGTQVVGRADRRERDAVRRDGAARYRDGFSSAPDSDEVAYVLSGEITFLIGDKVTVGRPGSCAFMPRSVPHAWKSTGTQTGRVLFLYTPAGAGKLFEEGVGHPIASFSDGEFEALARLPGLAKLRSAISVRSTASRRRSHEVAS